MCIRDRAINTTFLSVNLMVILLLLNVEFRRHLRRGRSFEVPVGSVGSPSSAPNSEPKRKSRRENLQQQFTAVAMYLAAILLLSALPHVITAQVFLYSSNLSPPAIQNFQIALQISDLLLFLKVCLDTFVYAWRLPTYRRTIKMLFFRRDICGILCLDDNQTGNSTSSELSHI